MVVVGRIFITFVRDNGRMADVGRSVLFNDNRNKMFKIIYNRFIPVKRFWAINMFGVIFVRKENADWYQGRELQYVLNHEQIHTAQMRELGYVLFYVLYVLEWLVRLIVSPKSAYRDISFEREAKRNERNLAYLENRKHFSNLKYIKDENS